MAVFVWAVSDCMCLRTGSRKVKYELYNLGCFKQIALSISMYFKTYVQLLVLFKSLNSIMNLASSVVICIWNVEHDCYDTSIELMSKSVIH